MVKDSFDLYTKYLDLIFKIIYPQVSKQILKLKPCRFSYLFFVRVCCLLFLFFLGFSHCSLAQSSPSFPNPLLESLLQRNKYREAETLILQELEGNDSLSPELKAYYLNKKSQVALQKGEFANSLSFAKNSEFLLESNPNSTLWGETFRAVCFAYIRLGKLDSALFYAEKLNEQAKKANDSKLRRSALVALGNISLQNLSFQKSLDFYLEALHTTETENDSLNLKGDYYNVGLAYGRLRELNKSNDYLLKAAERAEKEQALDLLARCYGSMADNFLAQKNYSKQEEYLQKANFYAEKIGNTQLLAMGYAHMMELQLQRQQWDLAITSGNKSLEKLKNLPLVQLQAKVDSLMYAAFKGKGDYEKALSRLESYDSLRMQIRNEVQKEKLNQMTVQFEVEKKDLQIKNQESALAKEKANNQLLLAGIISLALIAFFLGYISFKKAKNRALLFKKEKELDFHLSTLPNKGNGNTELVLGDTKLAEGPLDHERLFQELLQFIQTKKLYLDPKFNQQSLVSTFGTNRQYIYEAISKNGDDNFRGLINRFRINEAKKIIQDCLLNTASLDFGSISEKVGFNSYPTFYRSFKSLTGLTPIEFANEIKRDLRKQEKEN